MAKPRAAHEIWWEGLRWVDGAWMQCDRFEQAFAEHQSALMDADARSRLTDPNNNWRRSYDENYDLYDPARPIRVPTLALSRQVWNELDLFIVAVRNVLRAQRSLPEDVRTQMSGQEVLELLRNLAEHYDEEDGPSAAKLATDHPDVVPGEVHYTNKEIWVGGVPLSRVVAWLARVQNALKAELRKAGQVVPDDFDSVIAGDDDLDWPPDRRRYRLWSVPQEPMEDWPEPLPPDVAEGVWDALAEMFGRRRLRDHTD